MRKLLARLLTWLLEAIDPKVISLHFLVSNGNTTHKAKHMNTQITDTGIATLIAACVTAAGNPVPGITWSSSDDSVATVTPSADGTTATVAATGKLGTATITAAAGNLTATDDITVIAGSAVSLTLTEAPEAAPTV
jgi:uncharacterized protein YjdB